MKVIILDSKDWQQLPKGVTSDHFVELIEKELPKVKKLLSVSEHLNIIIKPNLPHVIDVRGTGASTYDAELVDITFDPKRAGEEEFFESIRASIYHELNHAARFYAGVKNKGALDWIILEGLATVFEREYSGSNPPWGQYDKKLIKAWVQEIKKLGEGIRWSNYMFKHPDGRRWIGYKVGTYIVDEALSRSGKTILELTTIKNEEIMKLSGVL